MRPRRSSLGLIATLCALSAAAPASAAPDQYRWDQWGVDAIAAPEAWAQSTGDGVVVAVVDTGVQIAHPDLAANIWTNPDEIAVNGIDDDQNGFVDDVHGANTLDHSGDVEDDAGHGTPIAGVISARANNGIGITGVAPDAHIMPVKVHSHRAPGNMTTISEGLRYAVSEGASIISISVGVDGTSPELDEAIAFAEANDVTIVAAAGNDLRNIDKETCYPASAPNPNVLGVAALVEDGSLTESSSFGTGSVELAAPGRMVTTTMPTDKYGWQGGTSLAAPFVAGALALLAGANPELSQAELRDLLVATARRTRHTAGKVSGGQLDVGAAMHRLVPGDWSSEPVQASASRNPVGAARPQLRVEAPRTARFGKRVTVRWKATAADAVKTWRVTINGRRLRAGRASASIKLLLMGRVRWTVTGFDADGRRLVSATKTTRVSG